MIAEIEIDEERAWRELVAREASASFFYGVTSTGVFCRLGCASRLPLRENTRFFVNTSDAVSAGFRACQRCKPEQQRSQSPVATMCAYLERQTQANDRPVRLKELGNVTGMSLFSAQKLFKQQMGVTPAQYQRALRARTLRSQLRDGESSVTDAIYAAGYGSSSRAYEQSPLGMTPGKFLAGGRGETIRFATSKTDRQAIAELGWIILASTERGLCWLAMGNSDEELEAGLRDEFPAAKLTRDPQLQGQIDVVLEGVGVGWKDKSKTLPLDLRGTAFQLRVWKALTEIPAGETRSYSQLAAEIANHAATRAVARACALNRVSILVPCHRVVGVSGSLTGYRWGVQRKRELLKAEGARLR